MIASKRSGMDATGVYVPHLWYYELLLFLTDQETPRPGVSNIEDENSHTDKEEDDDDQSQ